MLGLQAYTRLVVPKESLTIPCFLHTVDVDWCITFPKPKFQRMKSKLFNLFEEDNISKAGTEIDMHYVATMYQTLSYCLMFKATLENATTF